ncbi:hypothetical protein QRQ56_26525 [Bradyrhizobium sp. U531]|uniref:hypothetical protein n=1 Tax=Bradyrhizobium sp. U531 TaxID=3053458 RepID=UPI003F42093B
MSKTTFPVNGGAMPATIITNVNFTDFGQLNRDTALVCHGVLRTSANGKPRHPRAALLSKIMIEAHARAKADYANELSCRARAHHVNRSYSYYLGLQMRSGFAEARVARTGMAPAFELPAQRWA